MTNWADWAATKRSFELYARVRDAALLAERTRTDGSRTTWVTENQEELVTKRVNAAQQMFDKHAAESAASEVSTPATDGPVNSSRLS